MESRVKLHDLTFEKMIPAEDINASLEPLAKQLNRDYKGVDTPLIVAVLNGSFMFLSDLVKMLDFNCEITFVKLSSYCGAQSSGVVKDLIGLNESIEGRDVIIVEDIVDTGESIVHITSALSGRGAKSIKVCTLFFKPESYTKQVKIDYRAMNIGNEFIVGYGLDYNGLGRNLKDIYVVVDE